MFDTFHKFSHWPGRFFRFPLVPFWSHHIQNVICALEIWCTIKTISIVVQFNNDSMNNLIFENTFCIFNLIDSILLFFQHVFPVISTSHTYFVTNFTFCHCSRSLFVSLGVLMTVKRPSQKSFLWNISPSVKRIVSHKKVLMN